MQEENLEKEMEAQKSYQEVSQASHRMEGYFFLDQLPTS
jgi:hypothetical protein